MKKDTEAGNDRRICRPCPTWYSTFLQIKITLPGGDATSIHLGNAVCVLGALILGGLYGGIGGALGMTIGDIFDPVYVVYAPKTFLLKLCIGLITGLIAHKLRQNPHISDKENLPVDAVCRNRRPSPLIW